jgi:hypothetical protein
MPAWVWFAAAGLVVVLVIVIAVFPSGSSNSSPPAPSTDAVTCQRVSNVLNVELTGTSLGDLTNQAIASPKSAAAALQQYASAFREAAQAASADPRVHKLLDAVANDAGFAGVAASTGFGNIGADLTKLAQDVATADTACGISGSYAQ